jgi:excisionase family DNA binding protein
MQPKRTRRSARRSPAYLSGRQVATLLHVSSATVSRWARASWLPYIRTLGGHRRYPAQEIEQLVQHLSWPGQLDRRP